MATTSNPVIVAGARTPIGRFGGGLTPMKATELGAKAIAGALERAGISGDAVDHVAMGLVIQADTGEVPARQAAFGGGIPLTTPATTVNKACLSGMNAIAMMGHYIQLGLAEVCVAGGMESMTNAPYMLPQGRYGARMGDTKLVDSMLRDGLNDAFEDIHMGQLSDRANKELGITREEQDAWSARSHERAAAAAKTHLAEEIVPVEVPAKRGETTLIETDEGIRPEATVEGLAKLRPAFDKSGTITAGNASQISDGACAVVITSREHAEAEGLPILAEILSYGAVSGPDTTLQSQPSRATKKALELAGLSVDDVDLFEINEAFAAVALQSTRELGIDENKVNVNGGAVALGHPVGASGARVVLTLAMELKRRGGGVGAASLCGGGGQGDAMVIRVPA